MELDVLSGSLLTRGGSQIRYGTSRPGGTLAVPPRESPWQTDTSCS